MLYQRFKYIKNALRNEWISKDELSKLSMKMLRTIVVHAYKNVPYYHRKFKEHKIKLDHIKTFKDLEKIPLMTKDDVIKNYEYLLDKNIPVFDARSTAGTTGKLLHVIYDRNHVYSMNALFWRQLLAIGYKPWWKILYFDDRIWKPESYEKILNSFNLFRRMIINVLTQDEKIREKIAEFQPTIIIAPPSLVLTVLSSLKGKLDERIFILGGEGVTEEMKQKIKKKFNSSDIFEWYGCWEFGRLAWECREHSGLHLNVDSSYFEFLDKNGENVTSGEKGEVVITSLINYKMPLIRYKMGDIAIPLDDLCSCGRSLALIKNVVGRSDDVIILPDGTQIYPDKVISLFLLFYKIDKITEMKIIQDNIKELKILVRSERKPMKFLEKFKALVGKEIKLNVVASKKPLYKKDQKLKFITCKIS